VLAVKPILMLLLQLPGTFIASNMMPSSGMTSINFVRIAEGSCISTLAHGFTRSTLLEEG
jgi:hypothetical protein